jgi:hypothetical protein
MIHLIPNWSCNLPKDDPRGTSIHPSAKSLLSSLSACLLLAALKRILERFPYFFYTNAQSNIITNQNIETDGHNAICIILLAS